MASVTLSNVRKTYGNHDVLHGIDLDIPHGEFLILVGPSGCGKSTLLRMIAGLESITSGEVSIGGRVVNDLSAKDRDIAMVFQSYALYPHMNVYKNMAFSLRLAKIPAAEIDKRVRAAAETLGLTPLLQRYPRHLSGGQRQRVAMGRAIVRSPEVFLFDEPLSNLDAKLRVSMRSEIKGLHRRLGTTAIYVTHDQVEAMTMADRIVVMNAGRIEQVGRPMELYDKPRNLFVAGFIGSPAINLIPGRVVTSAGAPMFDPGDGQLLPLPAAAGLRDGAEIVYGIRPKDFAIAAATEPGLRARVDSIEPTGSETFVYCTAAGHSLCIQLDSRQPITTGQELTLIPLPPMVHVFDQHTGERLERE